jgi:hypothetical protein
MKHFERWRPFVLWKTRLLAHATRGQDLLACAYANSVRTLQVDMVAFDNADQSIRAYEIKRGNGQIACNASLHGLQLSLQSSVISVEAASPSMSQTSSRMTNQARPTLLAFMEREELRPRHEV